MSKKSVFLQVLHFNNTSIILELHDNVEVKA